MFHDPIGRLSDRIHHTNFSRGYRPKTVDQRRTPCQMLVRCISFLSAVIGGLCSRVRPEQTDWFLRQVHSVFSAQALRSVLFSRVGSNPRMSKVETAFSKEQKRERKNEKPEERKKEVKKNKLTEIELN